MKTCLIVDDSRVVRKVASRIIDKLGFAIAEAEDGAQALAYCEKQLPDLILLDWYMPVMNGIDFLPKLRALPGGDKPVVVFCTTENDMGHIQQAIMAGANEYVMKPFDEEIITNKLMQVGILE
ncbi:MAG TPA: response regulator [Rickettsiales bacterium]|nr:response regulator [Rickettsiales bacterium]